MKLNRAASQRFVFFISTVDVPIAFPCHRDTSSRIASKQIGTTDTCTTFLHLIRTVCTVVVLIAHPHRRNAFVVVALELTGWTSDRRTVQFIVAQGTVGHFVASRTYWNTPRRCGSITFASKLCVQASVLIAVFFVRMVTTIVNAIAQIAWINTLSVLALILTG